MRVGVRLLWWGEREKAPALDEYEVWSAYIGGASESAKGPSREEGEDVGSTLVVISASKNDASRGGGGVRRSKGQNGAEGMGMKGWISERDMVPWYYWYVDRLLAWGR